MSPDADNQPLLQTVECDYQGLPALRLQAGDGACATLLRHGGQLVSWRPAGLGEQLYLSPQAVFDGRSAIRGGVPVIFPQFDRTGSLPRHGFARTASWQVTKVEAGERHALAVLRLTDDDASRAIWPHRFIAELSVQIGGSRLDVELAVEHRDGTADHADAAAGRSAPSGASDAGAAATLPVEPLRFTAALHTYFSVGDAHAVSVDGLQRLRYFDKVRGTEQIDTAARLRADAELDRIYFDVARPLALHDGQRRVAISSHGFADVVVWNPGPDRTTALDDLPDDGWREMFCVEAAAIGTPIEVAHGDCWIGRQTIEVDDVADAQPDAAD